MAIEALRDIQKGGTSAFTTGSGSGQSGWTTVTFPAGGADRASTFVLTNSSITVNSFCIATIRGMGSNDHTWEEHLVEELDVRVGNLVNGVGFEVYIVTRNVKLYGEWNVLWKWE